MRTHATTSDAPVTPRTPTRLLALALLGALTLLAALAPDSAVAKRGLVTGLADPLFKDPRSSVRGLWFDRVRDANAGVARIGVNWSQTVDRRPANATDPADPEYDWSGTDRAVKDAAARGIEPMLLMNTAPRWAEGPNRPNGVQAGAWRPNANRFGQFGLALAKRYSGSYPDPDGPGNLPRVRYYEAWNEGNLEVFLAPQFQAGGNVGPELYRGLVNAFAKSVKAVHASNKVIGPSLAPFGGVTGEKKERTRPMQFMRQLFCLKGRKKLKPRKCPEGGPPRIDIVSHHAITVDQGPSHNAFHPDDASSGDMDKVRKTLRAAEKAGKIRPGGRRPIWVSEYWWRSNPPSSDGVPLKRHARWIQKALQVYWRDGVSLAIYNLIRDRPGFSPQTAFGLYFRNGEAKPAATAFAFPFVANRRARKRLNVWGRAPATGKLRIERQKKGKGKRWKTVKRLDVEDGEVFKSKLRLRGKQKLRARVGGERSLIWNQKG